MEEFARTLSLIAEGKLIADPLITGKVGVGGVAGAFRDLGNPEAHAKIIVEPWRDEEPRLMNLRDLRYLVALAEHLHFGRAAEACFVSQPTLSTQIRKLEDELKVTLIERGNRQVILTPVGAAVVAQAHRVLRDVDDLVRVAEEHRDPLGGDVRVGIIPTVAPYLLPRILPIIRREFPKVSIKLNEGQTRVIVRMLGDGELDALILALPVDEDHLVQTKLYSEAFYLAVEQTAPEGRAQNRVARRSRTTNRCCCSKTAIACAIRRSTSATRTTRSRTRTSARPVSRRCDRWWRRTSASR